MPVLKNAKKKLKQDVKRTAQNRKLKENFRELIKAAKLDKKPATVGKAFSAIDKAAKQNVIHKNKAAHLKSQISKAISGVAQAKATPRNVSKVAKSKKSSKSKKSAKSKK